MLLALDIATKTGFAHSKGESGVWDLRAKRDQSAGMRLFNLRMKLSGLWADNQISLVVFEAARNAGPRMQGALVVQAELQGVVKQWCIEHSVDYAGYSPTEIKKHATGKGNANKKQMIEAAQVKWGDTIEIVDDNHADALWLLDLALKKYPSFKESEL